MPLGTWGLWLLALATAIPMLIADLDPGALPGRGDRRVLAHLATTSALIGLAAVLVLATVWGFLESLRLVPHIRRGTSSPCSRSPTALAGRG
jgi:fatty acid desaturase